VANGVFDQGLEDQVRHLGVEGLGVDVEPDLQPVAKPDLFDFEITLDKLQLGAERNLLCPGILE